MIWLKEIIKLQGVDTEVIAPVIISASRATDIPAFYARQFMESLRKGFLIWRNPFNNKETPVSLKKTKLIVFWTKNAKPMIPFLDEIAEMGIDFYFNYTLNDYESEGFEPGLPLLQQRVNTFINLATKIGKENVIWRFDPVILSDIQRVDEIVERIVNLAKILKHSTDKLVFSFVDSSYRKVKLKFGKNQIVLPDLSVKEKMQFSQRLTEKLKKFPIEIATCAESADLSEFGIKHNKCIDDQLISKNFKNNTSLSDFIDELKVAGMLKDKGQREFCGCIPSKDIGRYNSCGYSCLYCYAMSGTSPSVRDNIFK